MRLKHPIKRGIAIVAAAGIIASGAAPAFADAYGIALYGTYYVDRGNVTVEKTNEGTKVTYTDENKKEQSKIDTDDEIIVTNEKSESTSNTVSIKDSNVTISNVNIDASKTGKAAISASGNVNIELDGNNKLKSGDLHAGLEKTDDGTLTIKDDKGDKGSLEAVGGQSGAGIGGGYKQDGSNITITGGGIIAKGGSNAAGIGGGNADDKGGNADNITITGKDTVVNATGGSDGAGIGGGSGSVSGGGNASNITISGGNVTAVGGDRASGIGGGNGDNANGLNGKGNRGGDASNITISGKDTVVDATGGKGASGIGGGRSGNAETITITDSKVTAEGKDHDGDEFGGAGIGGGGAGPTGAAGGNASNITITDANVNAKGGDGASGIGGGAGFGIYPGKEGNASDITISGGDVDAVGGSYGAGIGGGQYGGTSGITIKNGADVTADGGKSGAGIGGGYTGSASDITIEDSDVTAAGGKGGAGIGGGLLGTGSGIKVSGTSTVKVSESDDFSSKYGAGAAIGNGGSKGSAGEEVEPDTTEIDHTAEHGYVDYFDKVGNFIKRIPHTVVKDEAVAPTCTSDGWTEGSHCSLCGEVFVPQERIPATGHNWGEWTITTPATENSEGVETRTCSKCNEVETRAIPKLESTDSEEVPGLRVLDKADSDCHFETEQQGNTLIVTSEDKEVTTLTGSGKALSELVEQGTKLLVFVTPQGTAKMDAAALAAMLGEDGVFRLVVTESSMDLWVNGVLHNELLK